MYKIKFIKNLMFEVKIKSPRISNKLINHSFFSWFNQIFKKGLKINKTSQLDNKRFRSTRETTINETNKLTSLFFSYIFTWLTNYDFEVEINQIYIFKIKINFYKKEKTKINFFVMLSIYLFIYYFVIVSLILGFCLCKP